MARWRPSFEGRAAHGEVASRSSRLGASRRAPQNDGRPRTTRDRRFRAPRPSCRRPLMAGTVTDFAHRRKGPRNFERRNRAHPGPGQAPGDVTRITRPYRQAAFSVGRREPRRSAPSSSRGSLFRSSEGTRSLHTTGDQATRHGARGSYWWFCRNRDEGEGNWTGCPFVAARPRRRVDRTGRNCRLPGDERISQAKAGAASSGRNTRTVQL